MSSSRLGDPVEPVLAAVVADPARSLVALDFDGTLAPIVAPPEDARAVDGSPAALRALAGRVGRLAVISGRPAADVARFLDAAAIAGIEVLGHYGMQVWHAGRLDSPPPEPAIDVARTRLPVVLRAAPDGVYVEDKQHSLVVHTRQAPAPHAALDALTPALHRLADELGLEAVPGRLVIELRPPGIDKGTALRGLVDDLVARVVVYVGDDLGDLPAFGVVEEFRRGAGRLGLTVAVAADNDPEAPATLRQRADLVLPDPAAVVGWLGELARRLG